MDLVSVIIPAYNRARYITDALKSVEAQSYRPIEIIVVDDGSTDETETVVRSWVKERDAEDLQARYRYQDNAGAPVARNRGLRMASGDWIKFLDSDDVLAPNSIGRQVDVSSKLNDNEIVFGDLGVMDRAGERRWGQHYDPPEEDEETFEYLIGHIVNTPTPLHRPDLLEDVGGFREDVQKGQEYDLHLRLAVAGVDFVYDRGVVAYKRQGSESDSVTASNSVETNPDAHLFIQDNRCDLAEEHYNGDIPAVVKRKLATGYWVTGRKMARAGYVDRARYCFERAQTYAVDSSHVVGPMPYRWMARTAGPLRAEASLSFIKRLLGRDD